MAEEPKPEYKQEQMKSSKLKEKLMVASLVSVLGFGSLGVGLGAGSAIVQNIFFPNKLESNETADKTESSEVFKSNVASLSSGAQNADIPNIIENIQDSVVSISIEVANYSFFGGSFIGADKGAGSGIIFDEDDEKVYIVTNNHVITDASKVTVSIDDDVQIKASYVGSNSQYDLAVISVLKSDLVLNDIDNVTIIDFGDSGSLRIGETVIALGNALGEGKSATMGIISALNKTIDIDGNKMTLLQTDAAINPGNSGGALVNVNGQLVGINTAKFSSYSVEGMGYSIPVNMVRDVVSEIMENGNVEKPYLGIMGQTLTEEMKNNLPYPDGVIVMEVVNGGSASDAGIRTYDVVTEYNGKEIKTMEDLVSAIAETKVGDTVTIKLFREGNEVAINTVIKDMNAAKF